MNGKKGIIDVWWLYDDRGIFKNFQITVELDKLEFFYKTGLTLLLPQIIRKRSRGWSSCKLRVFCCPALSENENFVKELSE